jgi:pimeloyl-ACP methyl ester carboxylesterase
MKGSAILVLYLAVMGGAASAQDCPDTATYEKAREVIEDLGRIVSPGGVQESYKSRIGGIDQWITARGQDKANPVVLFVHGGPASPLTPTLWQFQRPLEEYFTMVTYDQRGAGRTFLQTDPATIADTIHIARYVEDAIEVAEHLRQRHKKQKLILMGHSWGSIVGMHAALKRPDLFYAYVGIGQAINVRENERLSYEYGLEQAQRHNNIEAVTELEAIAPYPGDGPITRDRIIAARKWAQHYGGLSAYRETSRYFFRAPLLSPEYTATDVCAIDNGNLFTLDRIMPEFQAVDFKPLRTFPIPVVMLMGRHDFTTPQEPAAEWLARVSAPYKQGIWFEHSSHMVPWEEPGKMLVSLLEHVRPLATAPKK